MPEFCFTTFHCAVPVAEASVLLIGLSQTGKIHVVDNVRESYTLATNANSMIVASGFVIFTTNAHEVHFASLTELFSILASIRAGEASTTVPEWERRRVERGSRIVTAVPSAMSLVLQMPRGNLETINPRPLVMEVVKQDIDA